MIQKLDYISAQGVIVLRPDIKSQSVVKVIKIYRTIYTVMGIVKLYYIIVLGRIVFVLYVADDLLHKILGSDKAGTQAILI